jgi:hypothetical protein
MLLHTDFVYKVPVHDAIGWQLYKTDLSNELTDRAEQEAIEKGVTVDGVPFREADCYSDIKTETEGNVVSFVVRWKNWRDDLDFLIDDVLKRHGPKDGWFHA